MLIRHSGRVLNEARGHRCTFPECAVAGYQSGKETHHFLDATRFFNEARAVNLVDHPGVVQVSDYGQLPDGTAYIVMEYLKGESLARRIGRATIHLPYGEVLQIAWQIADTLAAAHSKGIVHRDQ